MPNHMRMPNKKGKGNLGVPLRRDPPALRSKASVLVGIDTGGTFTDLVAVELERGRYHYHKVPTVTADPARGILDVSRRLS